jgi:hypothetical protein
MSINTTPFTRENLSDCLKALGKEYRRLSGTKMPAEIVLIGGASILANYGFRELTYDMDAVIVASGAMKQAISNVGDKLNLPHGWLNADFKRTESYSDKLLTVSVYFKTFSNVLQVRTVAAEYLVAMKLMSGRRYKNDLSDIYGILWEHQKSEKPLSRKIIENAIIELYGSLKKLPDVSIELLEKVIDSGDFENLYNQSREDEKNAKDMLVEFEEQYPNTLKAENIDTVLEQMKRKRNTVSKKQEN